jgi:hypothetical protein
MAPSTRKSGKKRTPSYSQQGTTKRQVVHEDNHALAKLERQLAQMKETNAKLTATVMASNNATNAAKHREDSMNKVMKSTIDVLMKTKIWQRFHFIHNLAQEKYLAKKIWKNLDQPKKITEDEAELAIFTKTYGGFITQSLNNLRTYKAQRLGTPVLKLMGVGPESGDEEAEDNDANTTLITTLPNTEQMLKCLRRDIETTDTEMMQIFLWYWDCYLPMAAGQQHFKPCHRRYDIISTCAPEDKPKQPFITPYIEAFSILIWENNREKWEYTAQLKKKFPGLRIVPSKKKSDGERPTKDCYEVVGDKLRVFGPKSLGKWTLNDAGQEKFGGWTNEGLTRYKELVTLAKAARDSPHCKSLEKEALRLLRQTFGLRAANHKAEIALNGGAHRRANLKDDMVDTWGSDIDSDASHCDGASDEEESEGGDE